MEELCIYTPTSLDKLNNIFGFNEVKIKKFGQQFIDVIKKYAQDNDIIINDAFTIKTVNNKSNMNISIIKDIDKKIDLEQIAKSKDMTMDKLLVLIEYIVNSGVKISLDYYIDQILDEEQQDEIISYFNETKDPSIPKAYEVFDGEYSDEELRLIIIKIKSEL